MKNRESFGQPFRFETADFDFREKEKIRSEINTNYGKYAGKMLAVHISYGFDGEAYKYYFENHGFDDINIFIREKYGDDEYE